MGALGAGADAGARATLHPVHECPHRPPTCELMNGYVSPIPRLHHVLFSQSHSQSLYIVTVKILRIPCHSHKQCRFQNPQCTVYFKSQESLAVSGVRAGWGVQ